MELANKKTAFGLLAKFADFGFPILIIPLLLNDLGAEDYAALVRLLSILAVCQVLINFGSEDLGQNELLLGKPIESVLGEIITMKALIFMVLFAVVGLFGASTGNAYLVILYVYLFAEVLNINFYFIYKDNVGYLLITKVTSKLIFLSIILFFDMSLGEVVYSYIAQSLVFWVFVAFWLRKTEEGKIKLTLNPSLVARGYKLVLSNTASVARDKLPFLLLDPTVNPPLIVVLDLMQKAIIVFNSLIQTVVISNLEFWRTNTELGLRHIVLMVALVSPALLLSYSFTAFNVVFEIRYVICCVIASCFYFYSIYLAKFVYLVNSRYTALVVISVAVLAIGVVIFGLLPLHYLFTYFVLVYFVEMILRAVWSYA